MQRNHSYLRLISPDSSNADSPESPQVGIMTLKPATRNAVIALSRSQRKRLMTLLTALRDAVHSDPRLAEKLKSELQIVLASIDEQRAGKGSR